MTTKNIVSLIFVAVLLCVCIILSGCGTYSMGFGEFDFKHLHYSTFNGEKGCVTIETWYESESGIEVDTTEHGSMFFSEGTYILIEDKSSCPFCKDIGGK